MDGVVSLVCCLNYMLLKAKMDLAFPLFICSVIGVGRARELPAGMKLPLHGEYIFTRH